jgi:methionyl-tRNA synthetase
VSPDRFYVTTPIYYVNAEPHLGHAYTSILCDAARRFNDMIGARTYYLTGTDEHGENIMRVAAEQGRSEQDLVDENSEKFRQLWPRFEVRHDDFIRTTEPRHIEVVQRILSELHAKDDIYKAKYSGVYCVHCERFYTEKELDPKRGQVCPIHETELSLIEEENYFFRMSKYQDWLREKVQSEPQFINPPQFANEVLGILRDPLDDLCISRPKARMSWGIPLPFDPDYVVYVWFDALINYVSALGGPGGELFGQFWPAANHVIGKDILRPHAVYWPIMLKAAGIEPYQRLHVHGWWQSEGKKMSKTRGNVVDPVAMAEEYGPDTLRYFLLREMVFGADGDFTQRALIKRYNSDLANDFGNLVSRVTSMIGHWQDGVAIEPGDLNDDDQALAAEFQGLREALPDIVERMRLSDAIEAIMQAVRATNRYIDRQKPWDLPKKDPQRLKTVLYVALQATADAAGLLWPVMPVKCDEALVSLGADAADLNHESRWSGQCVKPGAKVQTNRALFPRIDAKAAKKGEQARDSAKPKKADPKPKPREEEPGKATIQFEDFAKLDLRVATIVEAEKHPKADRLMRLVVDLGNGLKRQIVAGIAEAFDPADLPGRQIVVVANLAPRALRGLESQGMLLAATDAQGLKLIAPSETAEPGTSVS